jgi:hypothetical protein
MAENKKLEEIVDLLAEYGGFDRDYLRDKLLINFKEKADNKNKMQAVAEMFGKKLDEEFTVKDKYKTEWHCKFRKRGLLYLDKTFFDWQESGDYLLQFLLTGRAVIVDE